MGKQATIKFSGPGAKKAFRRAWQRRCGWAFEERDLLGTDGAYRAADIANELVGVSVNVFEDVR